MKTLIATFTSALALLALAAGGASAKSAAPACATEGKTLEKTSTARVYSTSAKVQGRARSLVERRTYACLLATGDRLRIDIRCRAKDVALDGETFRCLDVPSLIAINGPYVAVATKSSYEVGEELSYQDTVFAKLGRTPDKRSIIDGDVDTVVERLYISPTGALAYGAEFQVMDSDWLKPRIGYIKPLRRGRSISEKTLDAGLNVLPKSLTTAGGKLTWRDGGRVKTAAFR